MDTGPFPELYNFYVRSGIARVIFGRFDILPLVWNACRADVSCQIIAQYNPYTAPLAALLAKL